MAGNLPDVGLNAVIDNLAAFQKGADSVTDAYDNINEAADDVEVSTGAASGALSTIGGVATTVATGGMALLVGAIAAVAAAATAAVASVGLLAKAAFDLSSEIESSQKDIQIQLGLTTEEAEKLGKIATEVWANNFAGSVEEASEALITVKQQLKSINDEELQDATENAIRLSDAFGIDIAESTNAANVLMKRFGLSQQEAFDFITKGFQRGLNSSNDFLDSVSEYGGLFGDAEGDAGQFFSLLETGLAGGVLGTDKAGDAFKEFSIRFIEGGDDAREAITAMGMDFDLWVEQIQDGEVSVVDAFTDVIASIAEIEDPIERNRLGVALLGTQFEDLGADAVAAINLGATSLDDLSGATDTLNAQYETLPQVFEGVKRQLLIAIKPIGDAILEAANEVVPLLFDAIEDLKPALEDFAVLLSDSVTAAVQELIPWIQNTLVPTLIEFGEWLVSTGIPALRDFAKFVWNDVIPVIVEFAEWIGDELIPFLQDLWKLFKDSKKQSKTIVKSFDNAIEAIEPLVEKVLPELIEIWDIIKKWTDKNWPLIQKTIETVMEKIEDIIKSVTKAVQKFWEKWGDELLDIAEFVFDTIFKVIKTSLENTLSVITVIMKIITGDWEGAWDEIEKIVDRTVDAINSIVRKGFDVLKGFIDQAMESVIDIIKDAWDDVKRDTETALNNLKNLITNIWNSIKSNVENIVTNMINSIVQKINAAVGAIRTALTNMFNNAINAVASIIGNLGSITRMIANLINSVKNRIIASWNAIREGITTAFTYAFSFFSVGGNLLSRIISAANKIMTSLKNSIAALWSLVRDGINNALNTAFALFSLAGSVLNRLMNIGRDIIDGIIDGINDAKSSLRDALEGVADQIPEWLRDWLGIGSPAKIMIPIGQSLIEGLQAGIMSQVPDLLSQMKNQVTVPMVAAPALGASTTTNITNVFNTGGNTIANNMDAAVFEQQVLQVIRRNL